MSFDEEEANEDIELSPTRFNPERWCSYNARDSEIAPLAEDISPPQVDTEEKLLYSDSIIEPPPPLIFTEDILYCNYDWGIELRSSVYSPPAGIQFSSDEETRSFHLDVNCFYAFL